MTNKKRICIVDGCYDEPVYVTSGLCAACYQGMLYWKDRTPTDIVLRQQQINRLANRMDMMQPHVKVATRRRRA